MAGKGIEISVAANTRDFQRGTKDVEGALEDVADALDDMAKDADKTGRKMGDDLADGAKDAGKAVDRLERNFKGMADAAKRETKQTGQAVRQNITEESGEAVREWGDEAKQNIAETFSSFRGESEDFIGIVQDTFGGVISNLGPLGAAFGAAGALGIGLFMGELERSKESEQEFREGVAELAELLIETGGEGADAVQAIADKLKALATNSEEGAENLAKLRDDAQSSASGFKRIADAYAGNADQLDKLIEKEREHYDALKDSASESGISWKPADQAAAAEKRDAQERIIEGLQEAQRVAQGAADQEAAWLASNGPAYEARAEQMSALQGELDEAVGAYGKFIDAESGAADPSAYIAAMQERMDATKNFNSNVQTLSESFGLTFEETQAILDQGVDFAPMLSAIMAGGPEMQEQYASQIRAMLDGGQAIIDGTETTATVTTTTDTSDAEQKLDNAATKRDAPVKAEADTTAAAKALDAVAAKTRTAKIGASLDLSQAEAAMSRFVNRQRTATVTAEVRTREGALVP